MLFFLRATDVDPEQRAIEEELFNSFLNSMVRGFFYFFHYVLSLFDIIVIRHEEQNDL